MRLPVIIVNFKTYPQGVGKHAEELAKICEKVAHETGKNIILAVEEVDLHRISSLVDIPVFSEHMDPIEPGAHTGHNLPQALKDNGASGTLINHSEDQSDHIRESIEIAKHVGLTTVLCANTSEKSGELAKLLPDFIAVEPPELIGGNVSVSSAKPEVITNTVKLVKDVANIPVLCGAGIKTGDDVRKAIHLGVEGILVASGIVKAPNPEEILREFANAL